MANCNQLAPLPFKGLIRHHRHHYHHQRKAGVHSPLYRCRSILGIIEYLISDHAECHIVYGEATLAMVDSTSKTLPVRNVTD